MKRLATCFLVFLMLFTAVGTAFADEVKPGDTVRVSFTIEANTTMLAGVAVSFDSSILQFSSVETGIAMQYSDNTFIVAGGQGGLLGTITFTVKENASGTTHVTAYAEGADMNSVVFYPNVTVSGGSITVVADTCTHNYESAVTTEATCEDAGVKTFTCSECGDSYTEEIAALGHAWDEGTVTTKATCSAEGVKTITCENDGCGETKTEKIAKDPDAHTPDENSVTVKPTCTTDGSTTGVCKDCGKELEKVVLPATGHKWDDGKITTEADCETAGEKTYTCENEGCGETKTEEIAALGHKWDEGTVTTKSTCSAEGEKTITCQNKGCGETKTEKIAKDPEAHTPDENSVTVKPTCTTDGSTTGVCKDCGAEMNKVILPATGHSWDDGKVTKEATCAAEGEKTFTCQNDGCGETKTEKIAALGHKYDEKVTTEPTCTAEGVKTFTCSVCEDTYTEKIAALGHKEETVAGKAATCTETGLTDGKKCTVCGEVTVKQEVIAAKGHTPGEWVVVKEATREEDGLKEQHCSVCDELLDTEAIPMVTVVYYPNNTACSMGPAFRDETDLTNKWYRFTPVDLSIEGTQTFDLIAGNLYIVGKVYVTVAEGTVTVECDYVSDHVNVDSEFCTILPSLAETVTVDQAQLKNYAFGEAISIADDLAGDTKVLLYICNVVDYHTDMPIVRIFPESRAFKTATEAMKDLMD